MYFFTINLRALEGGAARGGGVSGLWAEVTCRGLNAVAATHYPDKRGRDQSKVSEVRCEDLVDGNRRRASAPFWPRHHVWCVRFREHVKFPCDGPRRARRRDGWRRRRERIRDLGLERRRACVCLLRLELQFRHLPVDVVDRLVFRRRPIDDLAEFGRRRASRGPRGRRRLSHLCLSYCSAVGALRRLL